MDTLQSIAEFLLGVAIVAGMRPASVQQMRGLFVQTAQARGMALQSIRLGLKAAQP